jgi:hypothetical protein
VHLSVIADANFTQDAQNVATCCRKGLLRRLVNQATNGRAFYRVTSNSTAHVGMGQRETKHITSAINVLKKSTLVGPLMCFERARTLSALVHLCNMEFHDSFTAETPAATPWDRPPEWLDVPGATRAVSLGRSYLYQLIHDGSVRSICVRKPGCVKGKRLISAASLFEFLARQPSDITPEARLIAQRAQAKSAEAKRQRS